MHLCWIRAPRTPHRCHQEGCQFAFRSCWNLRKSCGLTVQLDVLGVDHVQLGAVEAHIVANLPGE